MGTVRRAEMRALLLGQQVQGDRVFCFSSNDEGRELSPTVRSVLSVENKEVRGNVTLFSLDSRLSGSIIPERHWRGPQVTRE